MAENQGRDGSASLADVAIAAVAVVATAILFYIDSTQPRGVLDGIGYPAVVVVGARFGRRPLFACAVLCTVLIAVAHFLVPNSGVSEAAELANRICGLASIWIITYLLHRRIAAETLTENGLRALRGNQAALIRIAREALASEHSFAERIQLVTEIAGNAMPSDLVGIFRFYERGRSMRSVDVFQRRPARHFEMPDILTDDTPGYDRLGRGDYTFVVDDATKVPNFGARTLMLESLNIQAFLGVGILAGSEVTGMVIFAMIGSAHKWSDQEIAFARAVGNLVTILFAAQRNAETLAALDLAGEGIYAETKEGVPVYANGAAIAVAGGATLVNPSLAALRFPRPQNALTTAGDLSELTFEGRELEIHRVRLPDGGIISRINDVTARNSMLRERDQLKERLQQAAKMEAIGQLAGGVAHDFNNILGAIMGFAGFLTQDLPGSSEQRHFAERILSATERGKELIDQILTFARPRGSASDAAELGQALRQTAELVRGSFPSSIAVSFAADADGIWVRCAAARLSQLLLNLCINARDAIGNRTGKIVVDVARADGHEPVALSARDVPGELAIGEAKADTRYARISVTDSGGGIPSDVLKHVFEPFYTTKQRQRGTGLGLAVVHGVIDSSGGFGHVRVRPGEGTTFSVYIPLADAAEVPSQAPTVADGAPRGTERVLVVDDEPDIVDMMVIGLERLGFRAVGVSDPLEAFEAFSEDPAAFDIVVTDLVMPSLRGTELIRKIKTIRPEIRAILCTAFSDGAAREVDPCVDALFRKPADATAIARCIRDMRQGQMAGIQE